MNIAEFMVELANNHPGDISALEPMSRHTSWRIGGPADIFVRAAGVEQLKRVIILSNLHDIPVTIAGAGTNLLVRDGGIRGLVIKLGGELTALSVQGDKITAGGGASLFKLAKMAMEAGVGGLAWAYGIPGTVGGAVLMNAGAGESSMSQVLEEVVLLDFQGHTFTRRADEMAFGYRKSILQKEKCIVLQAVIGGYFQTREIIKGEMDQGIARRKATQPLEYPNAGSVFKNPAGDSAGRLIEASGCKGLKVGYAQVSQKHANFIINLGGARARDVLELISIVRERVREYCGVDLETEIQVLGSD